MEKQSIGIIGASGLVGVEAVKTILSSTDYKLILGGRNTDKIHEIFNDEEKITYVQVDIFDEEQLNNFCTKCSVIVNCAGPAKKIMDKIALAAINNSKHYIDVSGDERLSQLLLVKKDEIKSKRLKIIISAGLYPGLSEIFPSFIAEKYFDAVDSLELAFAGQGGLSYNAAYDYVCSIEEDYGKGMTYLKNGKPEKVDEKAGFNISLPEPAKGFDIYPVLTDEFTRTACKYNIKSAYFFNSFQDKSILSTFMKIKILEQYKTEREKEMSAKILSEKFSIYEEKESFTMFHLKASGLKNGDEVKLESTLTTSYDGNSITGIVAANTAILIMEEQAIFSGSFFLPDCVNPSELMNLMETQGVRPELKFSELNC